METTIKSLTNIAQQGQEAKLKITVEVSLNEHISVNVELPGEYTVDELQSIMKLSATEIVNLIQGN